MIKKWLPRIVGLILIALVITVTRDYYYTYVIPYSRAKTEQELIWAQKAQANKERAEQKALEEQLKEKETENKEELEAQEDLFEKSDAEGDDFFLNLSSFSFWAQRSEYDPETGDMVEHKRRIVYPELIKEECPEYYILLTDGYSISICEYDEEKQFLRSVLLQNGEIFFASKKGAFFSLTLRKNEGEKSISMRSWSGFFDEGLSVVVCTEKWLGYSGINSNALSSNNLIDSESVSYDRNAFAEMLLRNEDDALADLLWQLQINNNTYSLSQEELRGNITYFVSSTEGDDNNTGLDKEHPKKTLDAFSGITNATVFLKCGDTFFLKDSFLLGNNSMLAAYGKGKRPVLDFYQYYELTFEKYGYRDKIWEADLSSVSDIVKENKDKGNCNIGQLSFDGNVNWNRVLWSSSEKFSASLLKNDETSWAVDWLTSKLYIHSQTDPNDIRIGYCSIPIGIELKNVNNIVVKGVEIKGAGKVACDITDSSDITVSNCYIHHIGGKVYTRTGVRYGNAVQVWNSGKNIDIKNNYVSWIFDTCFTNQGNDSEAICSDICFEKNIGTHFFWGIEAWGDGYSQCPFNNVRYSENILYDNVDVTNPMTSMHAGKNTKPIGGVSDKDYLSYRQGYKYHQMSSINVSNSGTGEITKIEDNIVWNTNRFLVFANNDRQEERFSALKRNKFYAVVESDEASLLRYNIDGKRLFCNEYSLLDESNEWHISHEKISDDSSINVLNNGIMMIAGEIID